MEVFEGTGVSTGYGARADSLSKDSPAGSIEALVEEFDRLRLAATDVVGAFDGLIADVAHQANAVVSTALATPAVVSQPGDLSPSGDDLLTAESDRLDLNEQTLELIQKQNAAIKDQTDIQEETVEESANLWSGFSTDMLGGFGDLFSKVLGDGEVGFGDLWNTVGKGFIDMVQGIDPDSTFAPVLEGIGGLVDGIINGSSADIASGASGLLDGVLGLFGGSGGGGQDFLSGLGGVFNQFLGADGGFMSGLTGCSAREDPSPPFSVALVVLWAVSLPRPGRLARLRQSRSRSSPISSKTKTTRGPERMFVS